MGMIAACVDLQLPELLGPELRPRQHALHGAPNDLFGPADEELAERLLLVPLGVAAVADVLLRLELLWGHGDPRGVEHDDVIAGVEVGRPRGAMLARENASDARRE